MFRRCPVCLGRELRKAGGEGEREEKRSKGGSEGHLFGKRVARVENECK